MVLMSEKNLIENFIAINSGKRGLVNQLNRFYESLYNQNNDDVINNTQNCLEKYICAHYNK